MARINADLANDLGNLAQRSLSMIAKNCAGSVPDWRASAPTDEDRDLIVQADSLVGLARAAMREYAIHNYLAAVFDVVAKANRYFAAAEPWRLARTDRARMETVLYATIETLRIAAVLLQPVMPAAMASLLDLLGTPADARDFAAVEARGGAGRFDAPHRLAPGVALPAPAPIFPRYVEAEAGAP